MKCGAYLEILKLILYEDDVENVVGNVAIYANYQLPK